MDTIERVNLIWENAEDKQPIATSFGFKTGMSYVLWVWDMQKNYLPDALDKYLALAILEGTPRNPESAIEVATIYSLADFGLLMMMLGRERERLEYATR
jgi:hypothetical protein